MKTKKVYWVKGFPNNGLGYLLFKVPIINFYVVKNLDGGFIFCNRVKDLDVAIKDKESSLLDAMQQCSLSGSMSNILTINDFELNRMREFLISPA